MLYIYLMSIFSVKLSSNKTEWLLYDKKIIKKGEKHEIS